jgi:formamidopyrimidine-DNA glycosylase
VPELPDLAVYLEALAPRVRGRRLASARLLRPFALRSIDPPLEALVGRAVTSLERLGKRIVLGFEGDLFLVIHLMIAGRLRWRGPGAKPIAGRLPLAAFEFEGSGTLWLTEAGSKKRASLHVVAGRDGLEAHERGGLEIEASSGAEFAAALRRENHTLKRALTDPRVFAGIGNSYSDEILWQARLSPLQWTSRLDDQEVAGLHDAARRTLREWVERLRAENGEGFPQKVTAFHPKMAVHGRYGQPCPRCGTPVQRLVFAENEANYCPTCQTGGRLLADRALSRLLKGDWPKTLEELEQRKASGRSNPS